MFEISIQRTKGYSGKASKYEKGYVAALEGVDEKYGFRRRFLDGEGQPPHKAKCTWYVTYQLAPGMYEIAEGGEKRYLLVSDDHRYITKAEALQLAAQM